MLLPYQHLQLFTLQNSSQAITQALLQCPDIILLDICMPDVDGYQVLKALQANELLKTIPVIALSAIAMTEDIARGLAAGFSHYLTKPINQRELILVIEQALGLKD